MSLAKPWVHTRRALSEWLMLAIVLLIFASYIAYSLVQDHHLIDAQTRDRLTQQDRVVEANLGRQLSSTNLALRGVIGQIQGWRKQHEFSIPANAHLKALADAMPGVTTMLILDAQGTVTASDKPALVGKSFAHREYFQAVLADPNPQTLYVSPPFVTTSGNFTLTLSRMVPGPNGGFSGMVVAALDPSEFKVLLNSVRYRPDVRASLIHADGTAFVTVPESKDYIGSDPAKPGSLFTEHLKSGEKQNVFKGAGYITRNDSMTAMLTIQSEGLLMDKPLVIAVERDLQDVFAYWRRNALKNMAWFAIISLAAIFGLFFYQRRWRIFDTIAAGFERERLRAEEALRASEERFRSLTRLSSDWYWEQDAQYRFIHLPGENDRRTRMVNEAHVGKTRWEIGAINLTESDWESHRAILQAHREFQGFEMLRADKAGKLSWSSISGLPIFDGQGNFTGYRGVAHDITASKMAADEIKRLAFHDSLTQLPNRRLFNDRLAHTLSASKRSGRFGALLFIDLDNFKPLNDSHGHVAGDLLLVEVARRISRCVRAVDTVARFGGDEFAVVLSELVSDLPASKVQAGIVADKIRSALHEPYILVLSGEGAEDGAVTHHCSASIGVALFLGQKARADDILKWADMAMYQAKEDGRNRVRFSEQLESSLSI